MYSIFHTYAMNRLKNIKYFCIVGLLFQSFRTRSPYMEGISQVKQIMRTFLIGYVKVLGLLS